jgi:hypothetical protein
LFGLHRIGSNRNGSVSKRISLGSLEILDNVVVGGDEYGEYEKDDNDSIGFCVPLVVSEDFLLDNQCDSTERSCSFRFNDVLCNKFVDCFRSFVFSWCYGIGTKRSFAETVYDAATSLVVIQWTI